jgi:hypothetical protein
MNISEQIQKYLNETLGAIAPEVRPCLQASTLPYHLQDSFEFGEIALAGKSIVLSMQVESSNQPLRDVRAQLTRIRDLLGSPVVYCLPGLASYERRNLIEQRVAFIVPGNQMYLPDLGIDLREHFRQRASKRSGWFSPSTQALLIWHLLMRPTQEEWSPSDDAAALSYTGMTATRAMRELTDAGLTVVISVGRSRYLRMLHSREDTWHKAKPYMRSPVKRTVWVREPRVLSGNNIRVSGLSALSGRTMLDDPRDKCLAISTQDWSKALSADIKELPGPADDACQVELWSYSPVMDVSTNSVDPLSLWLSLRENTDDRVQIALKELEAQLQW